MKILQVNSHETFGGAARMAHALHLGFLRRGHTSWLAAAYRQTDSLDILTIPIETPRHPWTPLLFTLSAAALKFARSYPGLGAGRLYHAFKKAARFPDPNRHERAMGHEIFNYPGSHRIPSLPHQPPDILHCHNLHGNYFDLRLLPEFSKNLPVVLTLHDAWLLSGHCAHSFDCERWRTGCGNCPDLTIPPAIIRDATTRNFMVKKGIYEKSLLYIATPSRWLMNRVEASILRNAAGLRRVIPNGVDLNVFHPGDKAAARTKLSLPQNGRMLLFVAQSGSRNRWKDWPTMKGAVEALGDFFAEGEIFFVGLGGAAGQERIGNAMVFMVPYLSDPAEVAFYYQAADLYLHAARADTFPNVVLEAEACGIPVIATAVGGIPEQIKSFDVKGSDASAIKIALEDATGVLTPPADPAAMAQAIRHVLADPTVLDSLGRNAARLAQSEFGLDRMVDNYLEWYETVLTDWHERKK